MSGAGLLAPWAALIVVSCASQLPGHAQPPPVEPRPYATEDPAAHWLIEAVRTGDLAEAKRIAAEAPHLVVVHETGPLLLTLAAGEGQPVIVEWLLKLGCSPTIAYKGVPPLRAAIGWDSATEKQRRQLNPAFWGNVEANLAKGSLVLSEKQLGQLAADKAAALDFSTRLQASMPTDLLERKARVVDLLLTAGASPKDPGTRTIVLDALMSGFNGRMIRLLIEAGADPTAAGPAKLQPLHYAAAWASPETVEVLLSYTKDTEGLWMSFVGINPADTSTNIATGGITPLMQAISSKRPEIVRLLLAHGANPNTPSTNLVRAIHLAAFSGQTDIVRILLERGARADPGDMRQITPLAYAAMGGHLETVAVLLKAGADLEAQDFAGYTPLLSAAEKDQRAVAEFLLANGADARARNSYGKGALRLAAAANARLTAGLMLERIGKIDGDATDLYSPLLEAASSGFPDMVAWLLQQGASVDRPDLKTRGTALIWVVRAGPIMREWAKNPKPGWSPLLADPAKYLKVAQVLLAAGTDINATDASGNTALHYAAEYGDRDMASLLLRHGVRTNTVNRQFKTPRDVAFLKGQQAVLELLDQPASAGRPN